MLHTASPAIDRFAVDLAPIDRFSVDLVPFPVDLARIGRRPVDCWRGTVTHMDPPPDDTRDPADAARREALQKALKELLRKRPERGSTGADREKSVSGRGAPLVQRRLAEHDLIDEITSAARGIADATDWMGEPVYRTDGVWRVLATVAKSPYCLAIADLGRALRVRKQTARELAHAAARARVIELAPNPQDKRILQALLTPTGRAELAAAKIAENAWLATLLSGLDDCELKATVHVVRVIRQRLERAARDLARHKAERARQEAERARRNALLGE